MSFLLQPLSAGRSGLVLLGPIRRLHLQIRTYVPRPANNAHSFFSAAGAHKLQEKEGNEAPLAARNTNNMTTALEQCGREWHVGGGRGVCVCAPRRNSPARCTATQRRQTRVLSIQWPRSEVHLRQQMRQHTIQSISKLSLSFSPSRSHSLTLEYRS